MKTENLLIGMAYKILPTKEFSNDFRKLDPPMMTARLNNGRSMENIFTNKGRKIFNKGTKAFIGKREVF